LTLKNLAWEKIYRLNDKYICPNDDSGTSGCAYYEQLYCLYCGCEKWATWLKGEVHTSHRTAALLQKGEETPDCTLSVCNPVNFIIFNLNLLLLYEEIQSEFPILVKNVTYCYVYAGTNVRDHWPWETRAKPTRAL
jgi:hypothetical protein